MTKTVKIIIAVSLAIIISVGAVLGGVFGARAVAERKQAEAEKQATQERQQAVDSVSREFLLGINENWSADMTVEELADTADAGDYIVFSGWAGLVEDVLFASPLQTAKIQVLADTIESEQAGKLFADFDSNAELLIPLLKQVGLTSNDVANLVYSLVYAFIDKGGATLGTMKDRLIEIKSEKSAVNVQKNLAAVNTELEYLTFASKEKAELLTALADAEGAIKELASFAYTTSIGSLTDNMIDIIASQEGALIDVTDGEIQSVVNAMLSNVRSFKANMTTTEIAKLNNAIKTVTDKFAGKLTTSGIFAQIVNYAKLAYVFTDSIPYLTSIVISTAGVVDADFLTVIREFDENKELYSDSEMTANLSVIAAKLTKQLFGNIDKAEIVGLIETLEKQAKTDYRRAVPLVAGDFFVNIMAYDSETDDTLHPSILSKETFEDVTAYVIMYMLLDRFEQTYYKFVDGRATDDDLRKAANACPFDRFGIVNPYSRTEDTARWFEFYMTSAADALYDLAVELAPTLKADLLQCVEDYCVENSPVKADTYTLAAKALVVPLEEDATDEEKQAHQQQLEEYLTLAKSSRSYGLAVLIGEIFEG